MDIYSNRGGRLHVSVFGLLPMDCFRGVRVGYLRACAGMYVLWPRE